MGLQVVHVGSLSQIFAWPSTEPQRYVISWSLIVANHSSHTGKASLVLEAIADADLYIWGYHFGEPGSLNDLNVLAKSTLLMRILTGICPSTMIHTWLENAHAIGCTSSSTVFTHAMPFSYHRFNFLRTRRKNYSIPCRNSCGRTLSERSHPLLLVLGVLPTLMREKLASILVAVSYTHLTLPTIA